MGFILTVGIGAVWGVANVLLVRHACPTAYRSLIYFIVIASQLLACAYYWKFPTYGTPIAAFDLFVFMASSLAGGIIYHNNVPWTAPKEPEVPAPVVEPPESSQPTQDLEAKISELLKENKR